MRQIKFRGKRVDDGKWVHGSLIVYIISKDGKERWYTIKLQDAFDTSLFRVIPESVGQFTGLTDKNGIEIYEGDIMQIKETEFNIGGKHEVYYYEDGFVTSSVKFTDKEKANKNCLIYQIRNKGAYVIGNIHDNLKILNEL